jgi:hypothetical protein
MKAAPSPLHAEARHTIFKFVENHTIYEKLAVAARYEVLLVVVLLVMNSAWSGGCDQGTSGKLRAIFSRAGSPHSVIPDGTQT